MHSRRLLFTALTAFVATSALAIPLSPPTQDLGRLQRRDPPAWSGDNVSQNPDDPEIRKKDYSEADKQPNGEYKKTQTAANQCFERDIQELLNDQGDALAEGYEVVMKKCAKRHGMIPRVGAGTLAKLRTLAEIWRQKHGKGPKVAYSEEGLTEQEREYIRENIRMDERVIEYTFGVPPWEQAEASKTPTTSNGGSSSQKGGGGNSNNNGNGNDGMNAFSANVKAFRNRLVNNLAKFHPPPSFANRFNTFRPGPLLNSGGGMLLRPI